MITLDINLIILSEKQQIVSDLGEIIGLISLEINVSIYGHF
jgi:hypothetical protein